MEIAIGWSPTDTPIKRNSKNWFRFSTELEGSCSKNPMEIGWPFDTIVICLPRKLLENNPSNYQALLYAEPFREVENSCTDCFPNLRQNRPLVAAVIAAFNHINHCNNSVHLSWMKKTSWWDILMKIIRSVKLLLRFVIGFWPGSSIGIMNHEHLVITLI